MNSVRDGLFIAVPAQSNDEKDVKVHPASGLFFTVTVFSSSGIFNPGDTDPAVVGAIEGRLWDVGIIWDDS